MAKLIRFDLPINGTKVKTLDELRENMTVEILGHYKTGLLEKWLRVRGFNDELAALEKIGSGDDADILRDICAIFGVEVDEFIIAALLQAPEKFSGFSVKSLTTANNQALENILATISLGIKEPIKIIGSILSPTFPGLRLVVNNSLSITDMEKLEKAKRELEALDTRISNINFTKF